MGLWEVEAVVSLWPGVTFRASAGTLNDYRRNISAIVTHATSWSFDTQEATDWTFAVQYRSTNQVNALELSAQELRPLPCPTHLRVCLLESGDDAGKARYSLQLIPGFVNREPC